MNKDTQDFLTTLLWCAEGNEDYSEHLANKTIHDFSPEFVAGVESFVDAFRAHLAATGFDMDSLNRLDRSFGGNCFFSLSGHGCGFFDERDEALAELHERIKAWSGNRYRFEELDYMLDVGDDGKIDLSYIPEAIKAQRDALFTVTKKEEGETTHAQ